jgi:copper oxidase (laccase) domain-containing protein
VKHIEVAGICTACNLHEWYSHRGEHGQTGRFGALIVLK